ncbi:MAG: FHA domain-containing protein [Verrucomicrobiota bacterium]
MSNNQLPEYLQFHGQSFKTGRLNVASTSKNGEIYLHHGKVVYAETEDKSGLLALFTLLLTEGSTVEWTESVSAPQMLFNESVDALLFQLAQLEDNGQTDEESLSSIFEAVDRKSEAIKLTDLKNYSASFEVLNTDFKGFVFYLKKTKNLIGRAEDCDIILPDSSVSGHHATITIEPTCIRIADLGSTNGCFVNGELVTDEIIQLGDELVVGTVQLQMSLKLQRNIKLDDESAEAASGQNASPALTEKVDPGVLRGKTAKVTGPITWKNLSKDDDKKDKMTGIFGKMFSKKP